MTICLYQFLLSVQFYYTCLFITACLTFACFHGFIFHACVSLLLVLDVVFVIFVPCSVGPIPKKKFFFMWKCPYGERFSSVDTVEVQRMVGCGKKTGVC